MNMSELWCTVLQSAISLAGMEIMYGATKWEQRSRQRFCCCVTLVANMSRYPIVWDHHLENLNVVNCGIRGDQTQNVLWRVEHMYLPATVSVGLIHCGITDTNSTSVNADKSHEIAENVILCGFKLRERHPLMSIIIVGILPAEETIWGRKSRVEQVNCLLKEFCSSRGFLFVEPTGCWRDSSGDINQSLYRKDGLHLNKSGCNSLGRIYAIKAIKNCQPPTHCRSSQIICTPSPSPSPNDCHVPPPDPPLNPHSNSILYHRCHRRLHKTKKFQDIKWSNQFFPSRWWTSECTWQWFVWPLWEKMFWPCSMFRLAVVFIFVPVFMLLLLSSLMFCGLNGEINGRDYVHVNVIYFDVYNLSVVGVLFVAHL